MPLTKSALEAIEKSGMSAKAKEAFSSCRKALSAIKSELPADQWKAFRKAFAWEGDETKEEEAKEKEKELAAAKEKAKKSEEQVASLTEAVKKSVGSLNGTTPDIATALNTLAPLVGVTPTHQIVAQLPPEARAQFEAMQKSMKESADKVEALQKSVEAQKREVSRKELVQKASQDYAQVPGDFANMAAIQMALPETEAKLFTELMTGIQGAMKKSAIFTELGTNVTREAARAAGLTPPTVGGSTAYDKAVELAKQRVQKSDGKLTLAKAITDVFLENTELYQQHEAERQAADPAR